MTVELRLDDEDRERYGGPEWLPFDFAAFDDLDGDELIALERKLEGVTFWTLRTFEYPRQSVMWKKASAYLALYQAGVELPKFSAFKIKPQKMAGRDPADAVPLPQDGSSTSDGTDPATSATSPEPGPLNRRLRSQRQR